MPATAEKARAELQALATRGLDLPTFGKAALDVLTAAVPFSAGCWAPVDPATRLITGGVQWNMGDDVPEEEYIYHEYKGPDPFTFETLRDRPSGVATAQMETGGDLARSPRFTDLYIPYWDLEDEARIALQTDDVTWGFLALFREGARSAFTTAEQEYLSGVRAALAVGLRVGMLTASATELLPAHDGPVVLVVDRAGEIVQASVGAEQGMADLGGQPIGRGPLPFALRTLVGAARQFALGRYPTVPRHRPPSFPGAVPSDPSARARHQGPSRSRRNLGHREQGRYPRKLGCSDRNAAVSRASGVPHDMTSGARGCRTSDPSLRAYRVHARGAGHLRAAVGATGDPLSTRGDSS